MKITIKKDVKVTTDNPIQPTVKLLDVGQTFTVDDIDELRKQLTDLFSGYGAVYILDGIMKNQDEFFEIEYEEEDHKIPIYKIEMYIVELSNNGYSLEDIQTSLEQSMEGSAISGSVTFGDCKQIDIKMDMDEFDDSKWNKTDTPIEEYRELFDK